MRIRDLIAVTLVITLTASGCTENRRARTYGGTTYMDIAAGQRVLNAT